MTREEFKKHSEWIQHSDIQDIIASPDIAHPWFPAYRSTSTKGFRTTYFSALVPVSLVPQCLQDNSWDIGVAEGQPSVFTYYENGKVDKIVYYPFGNEHGIEPLVVYRDFHGMREDSLELTQEFRLYFNLFSDPTRKRFLQFNSDGDELEVVRYGSDFLEIKTDLMIKFCAIKQMALAIFVDSFRSSPHTLAEMGLEEARLSKSGKNFTFQVAFVPDTFLFEEEYKTVGSIMGKKYIFPDDMLTGTDEKKSDVYQNFIIGADAQRQPIKHTCDPGKLSNYFGKNPGAPNYLTPVFFRAEVLTKYFADPQKYSVEDGYLRCGDLWGIRMDNDHTDYVVLWLGDIGNSLSEMERNYWLSFNILPEGRTISRTNFNRAFLAEATDPQKPDLVFKHEYERFCKQFIKAMGWNFFLPLHPDDKHFLMGLRLLSKDSQSEFDSQLLALTKVLVDSLNERQISKGLTLDEKGKGIKKLEKFFTERDMVGFEEHIEFLRELQDLRSKSAAHRKGTNYEKLITDLHLEDEGQQRVFSSLLTKATNLLIYLRQNLLK